MLTPFEAVSSHKTKGRRQRGWDYRLSYRQGAARGPAVACCLQEIKSQGFFLSSPCSLLSAASQLFFNTPQTQRLGAEVYTGRLTLTVTFHRRIRWVSSPAEIPTSFISTMPYMERWLNSKDPFNWHSLFGLTYTFQQNIIDKWISIISCSGISAMSTQFSFEVALETHYHIDTCYVSLVTWKRRRGDNKLWDPESLNPQNFTKLWLSVCHNVKADAWH